MKRLLILGLLLQPLFAQHSETIVARRPTTAGPLNPVYVTSSYTYAQGIYNVASASITCNTGDFVVISVGDTYNNTTAITVTATGNTVRIIPAYAPTYLGVPQGLYQFFDIANCAAGTTTITATSTGSIPNYGTPQLQIARYTGMTTRALDSLGTGVIQVAATSVTCSVVPGIAGELAVMVAYNPTNNTALTWTSLSSAYTFRSLSVTVPSVFADEIPTTTGSNSASVTVSSTATLVCQQVTFR